MINVKLIRKFGLSEEEIVKLLNRDSEEKDTIFLFPEYTFKKKFTRQGITDFLQEISLNENSYLFCPAYILETEDEVKERIEEYVRVSGGDRSWFDNPLMRYLFSPRYNNTGYLVHGGECGNKIASYQKHISTIFDSFNTSSRSSLVKIGAKENDERIGIEYDDDVDHSKKQVSFPNILIDNKTIEFRVCADIECGSETDSDVVLVSAHNLSSVRERTKKSLKTKPLIVNDSGRYFIPTLAYLNGKTHRTKRSASKHFHECGIDIALL